MSPMHWSVLEAARWRKGGGEEQPQGRRPPPRGMKGEKEDDRTRRKGGPDAAGLTSPHVINANWRNTLDYVLRSCN